MTSDRPIANAIRCLLEESIAPERLEIRDESDRHVGHAGYDGEGESHFHVTVVSRRFKGLGCTARHRMIYDALKSLLKDRIHALSIKALTSEEAISEHVE